MCIDVKASSDFGKQQVFVVMAQKQVELALIAAMKEFEKNDLMMVWTLEAIESFFQGCVSDGSGLSKEDVFFDSIIMWKFKKSDQELIASWASVKLIEVMSQNAISNKHK